MLTPLDLNGKTFSKSFRGYDTDEVNQFFCRYPKNMNGYIRIMWN